jgi:hypothetical protein
MQTEHEQRRWRLLTLVQDHFGRDNDLVARVIQEKTGDKVSERSVQAWLIAPGRKSSRNVPESAVKALEDYVADPENRQYLKDYGERRERTLGAVGDLDAWTHELRSNRSVELATATIEYEERRLHAWQDALGSQAGKMLFEMERRHDAEMSSHRRALSAIHEGLRTASTFEEFKSFAQKHVRATDLQEFVVRDAKQAIANSSDEFAAPDAVIQPPSTN